MCMNRSACSARQGYSLGLAQVSFGITVGISGGVTGGQALALSPGAPFAVSGDGAVAAQLLGDLASYTAAPDFTSSMLMMPQGSSGAPPMLSCNMCCSERGMADAA